MKHSEYILTYRKLVRPEDLNHANSLFGGTLLSWADEAAAMYSMCQIGSKSVVTLKMGEVLFKNPSYSGDILEFWTRRSKIGNSSIGVDCIIVRKEINGPQDIPTPPVKTKEGEFENERDIILSCEFIFVHVDELGKPKAHGINS